MEYAKLNITSNFTFLRGSAHPEEWTEHTAHLGDLAPSFLCGQQKTSALFVPLCLCAFVAKYIKPIINECLHALAKHKTHFHF